MRGLHRGTFAEVISLVIISSALVVALPTQTASGSLGPQASVQVEAIGNYGSWVPIDQNPSGVVSMLQSFRNAVGVPVNVLFAVSGPQSPGQLIKKQGVTVDQFLNQAKAASGGQIIPTLNLNYYTSGTGVTTHSYCDPKNSTHCGPSWFFQVSSELMSLQAVATDPQKTVYVEAWDQFNRDLISLGYPSTQACTVLSQLLTQGWQHLINKDLTGRFSNCGLSLGQATGMMWQTSSPYLLPLTGILLKMSPSEEHLVFFDLQNLNSTTDFCYFITSLSADQKAIALTSLHNLQSADGYSFEYPLLSSSRCGSSNYYWDAATALQSNGTPFISLEETLVASAITSTTSTTTTSSSSSASTSTSVTSSSTVSSASTITTSSTTSTSTTTKTNHGHLH